MFFTSLSAEPSLSSTWTRPCSGDAQTGFCRQTAVSCLGSAAVSCLGSAAVSCLGSAAVVGAAGRGEDERRATGGGDIICWITDAWKIPGGTQPPAAPALKRPGCFTTSHPKLKEISFSVSWLWNQNAFFMLLPLCVISFGDLPQPVPEFFLNLCKVILNSHRSWISLLSHRCTIQRSRL